MRKNVLLQVDQGTHKRLKVTAAASDHKMSEIAEVAILSFLELIDKKGHRVIKEKQLIHNKQ